MRDKLLISTKATFRAGDDINEYGSSRIHIIKACEDSLRRLGTDYIDVDRVHRFDANTPVHETLKALSRLYKAVRFDILLALNFSGWHLMKSLSLSERYGWSRYVAHQAYYSLLNRDFEWELMPLGIEEKVGTIVWSPLAAGKLGGRYRRGQEAPKDGRVAQWWQPCSKYGPG